MSSRLPPRVVYFYPVDFSICNITNLFTYRNERTHECTDKVRNPNEFQL